MREKKRWRTRAVILVAFTALLMVAGLSAQNAYSSVSLTLGSPFTLFAQMMTGGDMTGGMMTGGDMGMMTGGSAAEEDKLPAFPTPLPRATTQSDIYLPDLDGGVSLATVDVRLREALAELKYNDEKKSYYAFSDGYAMAIDLEKFEGNGKFIENDEERWELDYKVDRGWLKKFLAAIANVEDGKYRVIVFVVSNSDFTARNSNNPVITVSEATDLVSDGKHNLPAKLGSRPFTNQHKITVLVYEFRKRYVTGARLLNSNQTSTKVVDHLPVFAAYVNRR